MWVICHAKIIEIIELITRNDKAMSMYNIFNNN